MAKLLALTFGGLALTIFLVRAEPLEGQEPSNLNLTFHSSQSWPTVAPPFNPPLLRAPIPLGFKPPENPTPELILGAFIGLPFRVDGTVNDLGAWSLWANPEKIFKSPGLNCSGLVVSAGRFLFNQNFKLSDLKRDRTSDSGSDALFGEDWDFGLDVALNLAEGRFIRYLPEPLTATLTLSPTKRPLGWGLDIHSPEFLGLLGELVPGRIYVFVISKPDPRFKGGLSYYHLGYALVDESHNVWFYHTTARAGTHRLNVAKNPGLATFRKAFPQARRGGERRILFLELAL